MINKSRLDNHYWVLPAFTAANLVLLIMMAMRFPLEDSCMEDHNESLDDDVLL